MAPNRIAQLTEADDATLVVLQGNIAFAIGCARGGVHAADGYPGTPSTEVIDKGLRHLQDRMIVGWSVNEANAVGVGFGLTMAGADTVVTMKIPGLFQAGDVVATVAGYTAPRGGLVLYVASDFVPSSTQYVTDPRYFLKSCFIPILEPRTHQELAEFGPLAAQISREHCTPVVVLANGLLCHSEGLVRLPARRHVDLPALAGDYQRFMNLPELARRNYDSILRERVPGLERWAASSELNRATRGSDKLGVIVHGVTELYLREVWESLPVKPSVLSLATTFPVPIELVERFRADVDGPILVLGDGLRFVQEELLSRGIDVGGKEPLDSTTEWSPSRLARHIALATVPKRHSALAPPMSDDPLGQGRAPLEPTIGTREVSVEGATGQWPASANAYDPARGAGQVTIGAVGDSSGGALPALTDAELLRRSPVRRPPNICAGCPYRAFGLVVQKLRKQRRIVASFGDIGCNTLLYFLQAIDTCTCMGASEAERQGAVLARPDLAGRVISVIGDSTECHSGLDATRNAIFRNIPGVKVVLDNYTTAMTGGQPAPSSPRNLAGRATRFDLVAALEGEGANVEVVDGFDIKAIEQALRAALEQARQGAFTVLVVRGACVQEVPSADRVPRYEIDRERCKQCDLCYVCPGIDRDESDYPRFTHLCNGCGGADAVCLQRCHLGAIVPLAGPPALGTPPPSVPAAITEGPLETVAILPAAIRVAVRGVGGQGNLFLGKVLAELALLAGFDNVVKGETHGMAQLGGAVISTFGCGAVHSPVPAPSTVDVLVALEQGEVLRPGFLELLRPGGVVVLNRQRLVPSGLSPADYPSSEAIHAAIGNRHLVELDALGEAQAIGDVNGRASNVVALGVLSAIPPFGDLPVSLWQRALLRVSPSELMQRANIAAFGRGRQVGERAWAGVRGRRGEGE